MSTPFQNRLVGTVIVAAVAIIFLPDILDGDKKTYQQEFANIPQAPTINFEPKTPSFPHEKVNALSQEELSDEVALDDDQTTEQKTTAESIGQETQDGSNNSQNSINEAEKDVEPVSTLPAKASAENAWVIQLGSFRHQKNVDDLVNKLTKAGYKAFTKPIKTRNGTLTKVFVGPEVIKANLEKKLPALKELTKVQGKVARFTPTK